MMLLAYILVPMIFLAWVSLPLLRPRELSPSARDALAHERTLSLLSALKKLRAQKADAANEDHRNIENRLLLELARIYHRQGVAPNPLRRVAADVAESTEACSVTPLKPGHAFCGSCQTRLQASYSFCPSCGASQLVAS